MLKKPTLNLTDILVITGIVISLTGSGLYTLMSADRRAQIETTDRLELEQALAFMTDEIKMSKQVLASLPIVTGTIHFQAASGSSRGASSPRSPQTTAGPSGSG